MADELDERDFEAWEVDLHGHRGVYHAVGSGPPVVLVHWAELIASRTVRQRRLRAA